MNLRKLINYSKIGSRLLAHKFKKKTWPVSVSLHVTRFCNISCTHCYAILDQLHKKDPGLKKMKKVVDELAEGGTVSIRLLGGEPLLVNKLNQLIAHIKSKGMYCEIVTNGMLIRKRVKEWPELRMVDSFSVSLDGNKYSHDKIRGKDNFEKVVDGIMCLVENKLPVRMHGAFSHEAFDQKAKPHQFMANLSNEFNIPFNVATYCSNPMKTNEDEENKKSFRNGQNLYQDLLLWKKNGVPVSTTLEVLEKGIKWFDKTNQYIIYGDESKIPNGHKKCMAGITNCFIDSDGKMYICIPNWGKGIDVYEHGVKKAYEYMVNKRKEIGCQICYNLAQWEYTNFFTFSNPKIIINTFKNILNLTKRKKVTNNSNSIDEEIKYFNSILPKEKVNQKNFN